VKGVGDYPNWPEIPTIENEHLITDARLYANRKSLIASLRIPRGGKIAEIGVWQGMFSAFLIEELQPRRFFAFDIFTGHEWLDWNGYTGEQLFDGLRHREFYERAMAPFGDITVMVEGPSATTLRDYTDRSFDLVYVDGDHEYDAVKADAEAAVEMVSETGYLVFNDYTMIDPGNDMVYGVVPVVNELVARGGWRVVGYALHEHLFCDIALCRPEHRQSLPAEEYTPVAQPAEEHPSVAPPAEQPIPQSDRPAPRLLYRAVRHPYRAARRLYHLARGHR